ncbi:hypothetical protein STANM309S_04455 [Streptomyces tanashiensis]
MLYGTVSGLIIDEAGDEGLVVAVDERALLDRGDGRVQRLRLDLLAGLVVHVEGEGDVALGELVGVLQADEGGVGALGLLEGVHDRVDLEAQLGDHRDALLLGLEDAEGAGAGVVDVRERDVLVVRARGGGVGELLVDLGGELLGLLRLAERLGDDLDLLVPVGAPRLVRVGDGRRDLLEEVVLLLRDAGPGGEDDVGLELGDGLDVELLAAVELLGQRGAGLLHCVVGSRAGSRSCRCPTGSSRCRPGTLPRADRRLGGTLAEGDDALRLLLDDGLAERALDGDGERPRRSLGRRVLRVVLFVVRSAPGHHAAERDRGGTRHEDAAAKKG